MTKRKPFPLILHSYCVLHVCHLLVKQQLHSTGNTPVFVGASVFAEWIHCWTNEQVYKNTNKCFIQNVWFIGFFFTVHTFYGGPVGQTTQHTTFLGTTSVTDAELQTGGGAVRPVSGSEQLCYVGTFQIREKVGQHFSFVIGQNPSPWQQFNVISCFYLVPLCVLWNVVVFWPSRPLYFSHCQS